MLVEGLEGIALIDTGATMTSVDVGFAARAKLPVVNTGTMGSSTESRLVPVYAATIVIPEWGKIITAPSAFGAPGLQQLGLTALLGRDVLQHCELFYDGPNAVCTLRHIR